jgi:hypothetical protein
MTDQTPEPGQPLTADEIRALLRTAAVAIKPTETLIIRLQPPIDDEALAVFRERVTAVMDEMGNPFRFVVIPADQLAVAETDDG